MKTLFLIFGFIVISFSCFSQDLIVRTNGNTIDCKIISVDSVNVSFTYRHRDMEVETKLAMNLIEKIIYEGEFDETTLTPDSIYLKKIAGKKSYYHRGERISNSEIKRLVSLNELAYQEMKEVNKHNAIAGVFAVVGVGLIAVPIIVNASKTYKNPNWYLAAAGGALIILAIPISLSARGNFHKAIDIYNEGLKETSMVKMQLLLGFTQNGIGVRLIF